jgi:hypothetical protein
MYATAVSPRSPTLLGVGGVASLAANVAVAEPSMTGRVIAAWPSFALIGSYELLMRQIRGTAKPRRIGRPDRSHALARNRGHQRSGLRQQEY